MHLGIWQNIFNFYYWYILSSVAEPHHFYAAPSKIKNVDAAPAPTLLQLCLPS
jgi:hypothetical protein